MEIVKKLSVGKLIGKVTDFLPDSRSDVTPVELGRVVGMARGIREGESQYGTFMALMGDFVYEPSVGPNAGKRFRSGQLFVPDVILDLVAPSVANLDKGESVELAFSITARNDETVTVGYSYGCAFLVEPEANDPLMNLMTKALPAPDTGKGKGKGK